LGSDRPRCGDARRVAEGVGLRPGVAPGLRGEVGRRTLGSAPAQRSPLGVGQLRDVRVSAPRTTPTQAAGGAAGWSKSEMMIVASARQLEGERVCFVGIGLPNIVCNLAKRTVARDVEPVYESGAYGADPARLPLSIGDPTLVTGSTAVTSMFELFAYYLQ